MNNCTIELPEEVIELVSWSPASDFQTCPYYDCSFHPVVCIKTLRQHLKKVHEGKEPLHRCDFPDCEAGYKNVENLNYHVNQAHLPENSAPSFMCPFPECSKSFYTEQALHVHQLQNHSLAEFEQNNLQAHEVVEKALQKYESRLETRKRNVTESVPSGTRNTENQR